ncbi:hypothetical protein Pst134EA_031752 [Puccinia striiformis f. sp. tritici]|uniref:uncharacterized protein n=1 Tax=Puccinia striiformis f. sp. tritici TaxID=168172 RepID=UPI0020081D37|nr:uncharacterized protein Pst134EA_031752 [Puccinia striiformis f. sp. tritici]KAH9442637.1 hypothetical protein Pst134EA_031752 [Puccinia striiformis f. sp. tritici]
MTGSSRSEAPWEIMATVFASRVLENDSIGWQRLGTIGRSNDVGAIGEDDTLDDCYKD